jgi:hypothetical protein
MFRNAGQFHALRSERVANAISDDPDTVLTRDQTAVALTQAGFPVRSATLATKACRGGGQDFLGWIRSRNFPPHEEREVGKRPPRSGAAAKALTDRIKPLLAGHDGGPSVIIF